MHITCISILTPTAENKRGASALSFHLAKYRPKGVTLSVYSFNINNIAPSQITEVEKDLDCKISILPLPWWWNLIIKLKIIRAFLRFPFAGYLKLPKKTVTEITTNKPDGIWVNGEEMWNVCFQFPDFKCVHTLPDCESLYYKRCLDLKEKLSPQLRPINNHIMWKKYQRMERHLRKDTICHLVGEADAKELQTQNHNVVPIFIRHPHYNISSTPKEIHFNEKIKILIAGQNNIYMQYEAEKLVDELCNTNKLHNNLEFTFLGKGWEKQVSMMKMSGYNVSHIVFAPSYLDEIIKHDIQITPITIGTGTKGKVLDALANGLLVIGTPFAMENIAVEHNDSCIIYNNPKNVINCLQDIVDNRKRYEHMAEKGRQMVLTEHGRTKNSSIFFHLFTNNTIN